MLRSNLCKDISRDKESVSGGGQEWLRILEEVPQELLCIPITWTRGSY